MKTVDHPEFDIKKEYYYIETSHEIWRCNDLTELLVWWVTNKTKWPALNIGRQWPQPNTESK